MQLTYTTMNPRNAAAGLPVDFIETPKARGMKKAP
jgi:hypothetical protein